MITETSSLFNFVPLITLFGLSHASNAVVVKESPINENRNYQSLYSDEFELTFNATELGIVLTEKQYRGFPVSVVSKIVDNSFIARPRSSAGPALRVGAIITRVNDRDVSGISLLEIVKLVQSTERPLTIRFRDPSRWVSIFFDQRISCVLSSTFHFLFLTFLLHSMAHATAGFSSF